MEMLPSEDPDNFVISEPLMLLNGCRCITRTFRRFKHMYEQDRPNSSSDKNKIAHIISII